MDSRPDHIKRSINQYKAYQALRDGLSAINAASPKSWLAGGSIQSNRRDIERDGVTWEMTNRLCQASSWMLLGVQGERLLFKHSQPQNLFERKHSESVEAFKTLVKEFRKKSSGEVLVKEHMTISGTTVVCNENSLAVDACISPAWLLMTDKLGSKHAEKRYVILSVKHSFQANGLDIFRASVFDVRRVERRDGYVGRYKQDGEAVRLVYHDSPTRCVARITSLVAKLAFEKMVPAEK